MVGHLLTPDPVTSLDAYLATDHGGRGIQAIRDLGGAAVIDLITESGLRGRGGGGFPTGRKWAGIASQDDGDRYLVVNGAEGEPGTFKDRALLRSDPYQAVEGAIVAATAIGASGIFFGVKGSFDGELENLTRAVKEFQQAGICADCEITIVAGPDEYLFGEEKAMLEVIEGKPPLPRIFPPYVHGLFSSAPQGGWEASGYGAGPRAGRSNPTLVNNIETLSNVPHILAHGTEWFRSMGTPDSPGTIVATVSGDVIAPDVGEVELGTPLRTVIDLVGSGVAPGRTVKAVFSGVANPVVTEAHLDTPLTYEHFAAIGTGMGAAGFIVFDDGACIVSAVHDMSRFLSIESCGQCPPCKLGSGAITEHLAAIEGGTATDADISAIGGWLQRVTDGNRCYLAVEEQQLVASVLRAFPEEFAAHIEQGRCPNPEGKRPFAKLVDLVDGRAVYDETYHRKKPDWTYEPA